MCSCYILVVELKREHANEPTRPQHALNWTKSNKIVFLFYFSAFWGALYIIEFIQKEELIDINCQKGNI